ncbi:MAG: addiction module protein [Gemmatimonadetes bacterium]|nr:addiction module protein [Gemmatimonadota bacterium]
MKITNERLASELMDLPAEQREFWAHVLLNGLPAAADETRLPSTRAPRLEGSPRKERVIEGGMTLGQIARDPELIPLLESELLRLPVEVRQRLATLLLDSVETHATYVREVEEEAHRRWLELEGGEVPGIDWERARAALRARFGR